MCDVWMISDSLLKVIFQVGSTSTPPIKLHRPCQFVPYMVHVLNGDSCYDVLERTKIIYVLLLSLKILANHFVVFWFLLLTLFWGKSWHLYDIHRGMLDLLYQLCNIAFEFLKAWLVFLFKIWQLLTSKIRLWPCYKIEECAKRVSSYKVPAIRARNNVFSSNFVDSKQLWDHLPSYILPTFYIHTSFSHLNLSRHSYLPTLLPTYLPNTCITSTTTNENNLKCRYCIHNKLNIFRFLCGYCMCRLFLLSMSKEDLGLARRFKHLWPWRKHHFWY
jgi:hypothetical protein